MINISTPSFKNFVGITQVSGNWLPAHNPLPFTIDRIDGIIIGSSKALANVSLRIAGTSFTDGGTPTQVYVSSAVYNGVYTVLGIIPVGGNLEVIIDATWTADISGGYANNLARQNYQLTLTLNIFRNTIYSVVRTVSSGVDSNGRAVIDVAPVVRDILLSEADSFDSAVNYPTAKIGGFFQVSIREQWTGSNEPATAISTRYFITYSALQFQNIYGANMYEYTPLLGKSAPSATKPDVSNNAKFLTKFTRPKYVNGWPFTLSFIYSEYLNGQSVQRNETRKNVNGSTVSSLSTDLTTAGEEAVNYLNISGNYAASVKTVDVYLGIDETLDGVTSVTPGTQQPTKPVIGFTGSIVRGSTVYNKPTTKPYAASTYISNYFNPKTYVANSLAVTEVKTVEVVECVDQPFYLMWLNTLGGFDYYMFQFNQTYELDSGNESQFEPYNAFIGTTERQVFDLKNTALESHLVGADRVSAADLNALNDLRTSPIVYRVYEDGTKERVLIQKGSFTVYDTRPGFNTVEFKVLQPEKQVQLG